MEYEQHIQSEFERGLFAKGVLDVDPVMYAGNLVKQIVESRRIIPWPYDSNRALEAVLVFEWVSKFNRKVPASWRIWHGITGDFEKAGQANEQLSPTLIEAGIAYPGNKVVLCVARNQILNEEQLAEILSSDRHYQTRDDVIAAQRLRGVSEDQINRGIERGSYVPISARFQPSNIWGKY